MVNNMKNDNARMPFYYVILLLFIGLTACEQKTDTAIAKEKDRLTLWAHAGQAAERQILNQQITTYNQKHKIKIKANFIPERTYNAQVQAAAVAGDLPCVLELDGPYLFNYIWQGHLQAIDALVSKEILDDLLPSILEQGRYNDKLFGVGVFDSGLGIFTRSSVLKKHGIRVPDGPADAWDDQEFENILKTLSTQDKDGAVLDLKLNYPSEWFTYAFSPAVRSAGGDLIDRTSYQSAKNFLNGAPAIELMSIFQNWFRQGYIDSNVDDNAFLSGKAVLSWAGHWEFERYSKTFGDDLIVVPLPDFGHGTKTGQGSWLWSMTRQCQQVDAVKSFFEFILSPEQVLAMANANGAVPARKQAIAKSTHYQTSGALNLFVQQLTYGYAIPRPKTPAYPVITTSFSQAFQDIRNGAKVKQALDKAVADIDNDIKQNKGYQTNVLTNK